MDIGVLGCAGRMGRAIIEVALETDGVRLVGGCERPGHEQIGRDLGALVGREALGTVVSDDAEALIERADAVIEFSAPEPTLAHAALCAEHLCAHVIGTTGLGAEQRAQLAKTALLTPIVFAPNMSQGVNLLLDIVRQVAAALDDSFDIEVVEVHHGRKVDAPSGTALALGQAAAKGRGVAFDEVAVLSREGITGARKRGDIGFATLRGGDVVGEHTVVFAGAGERVEVTHKATDRAIFARGAVRAACWAAKQGPGLYGMADVLGLKKPGEAAR